MKATVIDGHSLLLAELRVDVCGQGCRTVQGFDALFKVQRWLIVVQVIGKVKADVVSQTHGQKTHALAVEMVSVATPVLSL